MPNHDVRAIVNQFIQLAKAEGRNLTHMQLQKLPYIAHGWGLAILNEPLISITPRAWKYGPVYPTVYESLSRYRAEPVEDFVRENDNDPFSDTRGDRVVATLSDEEDRLLNMVWTRYRDKEGIELSALTHEPQTPWYSTWNNGGHNTPISNTLIKEHYDDLLRRNLDSRRKKTGR